MSQKLRESHVYSREHRLCLRDERGEDGKRQRQITKSLLVYAKEWTLTWVRESFKNFKNRDMARMDFHFWKITLQEQRMEWRRVR